MDFVVLSANCNLEIAHELQITQNEMKFLNIPDLFCCFQAPALDSFFHKF